MAPSPRSDTSVGLEGAPNFRDVGGVAAGDGLRLRQAQLYRSDRLTRLTTESRLILAGLAIGDVFDLRSADERTAEPLLWPGDRPPHVHAVTNEPDSLRGLAFDRLLEITDEPRAAHDYMCEVYADLAVSYGPTVAELLHVLDTHGEPVLVCCTAGKDRTGLLVALLLEAIGVPSATIDADFLLSNERFGAPALAQFRAHGGPVPPAAAILVDATYLRAAQRRLVQHYGSFVDWLASCGVDAGLRARVRVRLTERA